MARPTASAHFSQIFAAEGDLLDETGEDGRDCAEHQLDRIMHPPNGVSENDIPKRAATDARHYADEDDAEDIHTVPACDQCAAERKDDVAEITDRNECDGQRLGCHWRTPPCVRDEGKCDPAATME